MAKTVPELIASIKRAGSLEELYTTLGPSDALKNPKKERRLRLIAIPKQYGPFQNEWPADVKMEYDRLCLERDQSGELEAEQLQFEKKKRL